MVSEIPSRPRLSIRNNNVGGPMGRFVVSQRVRVKTENPGPNQRVPDYVRGRLGVVFRVHGAVPNYSHDHSEDWGPLYSVLFASTRAPDSRFNEKVIVDIHESWLAEAPAPG